jgi:hypothetical protein
LAMRARLSSTEMGFMSAVMDLSSAADAVDSQLPAPAIRGAPAVARRKTRLDSTVIPFSIDGPLLAPVEACGRGGKINRHREGTGHGISFGEIGCKDTAIQDRRDFETGNMPRDSTGEWR